MWKHRKALFFPQRGENKKLLISTKKTPIPTENTTQNTAQY
jgi:hypothetical protein